MTHMPHFARIGGLPVGRLPQLSRSQLKNAAAALALLTGLGGAADYGHYYWTAGRYLVSTDDAYVKADFTTVAPKVSGYIGEVLVADNQQVKAGQVLARIDDRDFRTALARAEAEVAGAHATIANLYAQIALQQSLIAEARSLLAVAEAGRDFARDDDARYRQLAHHGVASVQRAQQAVTALREKTAEVERAQAALVAAERKIEVLRTERSRAAATLARTEAAAQQARLDLGYTVITAPVDGTVGARSLRVGQYVQAGTQLMAVVPLQAVYIVANFKETQLAEVHAGQPVEVEIDGFPGSRLHGRVDSVAPASGLEFALLPPDNATGNFTKIVQRIPVKIVVVDDRLCGRLRPGMSVEPTIDTRVPARG